MDQTLHVGDVYEEKGATIPEGWVLFISGFVDTSTVGVYEITYFARNPETGENATRVKTVEVLAKPVGSITLNGDSVVSLALGDASTYIDAGATSSDGTVFVTNLDGTSSESFTGLPNVAGSYTLIYYVAGAFSNFVTRTIHIIDPNSGGGGGIISAPTTGPKSLTGLELTPPAVGPTNLQGAVIPKPQYGPKDFDLSLIPTTGPKNISSGVIPSVGPKNATLEHIPVTPAIGYPIESLSDPNPNAVVIPNVGYPIESLEADTTDDPTIPVTPSVGYPIESIEIDSSDPTVPVTPNTGYPIESIEIDSSDPTVPVTPNTGYPIENLEDTSAEDPSTPVKPNASYPIENLE